MSHWSGRVAPTPTAGPLMAAMIGLRTSQGAMARGGLGPRPVGRRLARAVEAHAGEVRAGVEAAPRAGHHDGAHGVVGVAGGEGLVQLASHGGRVGVQPLGAVQRDRARRRP